ncbi:MAG: phosphotransferase family protein [Myxococcota bacterium]
MSQPDESKMRAWVEQCTGGRIVACERQPRWRPAWYLDVKTSEGQLSLYFRGDRGIADASVYPLEHEMACLQVLESQGIPVPHVFDFCSSPRGILMERSPGRSDLSTARDAEEEASVQRHYMEILARIHTLDTKPFLEAGLAAPADPDQLALADLPLWERGYRRGKVRPEPLIEFGLRWLKRNVPPPAGPACFVCGDSGQFLFEVGRVTAILDLELAHLGDPAEDLGALRNRDLSEPLGDLRRAISAYEEFAGHPVDRYLVDYHTVRFCLTTPLATVPVLATARPGVDLIQYLCWYHVYSRSPIEVLAHMQGVELTPPPLPEAETDRYSAMHTDLVERLAPQASEDEFASYAGSTAHRTAEYLQRVNRYGRALEADDVSDINALLGGHALAADRADGALEAWILEAGPEADADLLQLLYRRCMRQELLLEPVLGEFQGAKIQMLD